MPAFKKIALSFIYRRFRQKLLFLLGTLACDAALALAQVHITESLSVENRSPYIMQFALARPSVERFQNTEAWQSHTRLEVANYLSSGNKSGERLFIDGETWIIQQTLVSRHGDTSFELNIPWLRHGTGLLDRIIYDFHELFHMPQNGRTDDRHDEIGWQLSKDGAFFGSLTGQSQGIGDLVLAATRYLEGDTLQARAQLKVPTGDHQKQTGSEGWDLGLAISQVNPFWLTNRNWLDDYSLSFWWGLGLNYLSTAQGLASLDQNHWVATGNLGMSWKFLSRWEAKIQFDSNTPVFDSEIRELGWMPVQLTLAGAYRFSAADSLSFAIAEDLRPRVTPDAIFVFEYRREF